jgi:hypothetical protein
MSWSCIFDVPARLQRHQTPTKANRDDQQHEAQGHRSPSMKTFLRKSDGTVRHF